MQTHADRDARALRIAAAFSSEHSGRSTGAEAQARMTSVEGLRRGRPQRQEGRTVRVALGQTIDGPRDDAVSRDPGTSDLSHADDGVGAALRPEALGREIVTRCGPVV